MFIEKYFYKTGSQSVGKALFIPELRRDKYMAAEFLRLYKEELLNVKLEGTTAFLYAGGPASHHSDIRNINDSSIDGKIVIKGQIGYTAYNMARLYENIDYVSVNANTCASSMYCLHEAKWLLETYDNVIIYAEDMVDKTQLFLFEQLQIDLVCGDGIAMMHLTKERTSNTVAEVTGTSWVWNKDSSPMSVSQEGYTKMLKGLNCRDVGIVKPHGTGTYRNDSEEDAVIAAVFPDATVIKYKPEIGHTQGASTIIELGMLLDREESFTAVLMASGLGAHYGGCKVVK